MVQPRARPCVRVALGCNSDALAPVIVLLDRERGWSDRHIERTRQRRGLITMMPLQQNLPAACLSSPRACVMASYSLINVARHHGRIQGFPTIKAWVNGKAAGEYGGDRSASAIKDWALGLLPNRVATVNKQAQARVAPALPLRPPNPAGGCKC